MAKTHRVSWISGEESNVGRNVERKGINCTEDGIADAREKLQGQLDEKLAEGKQRYSSDWIETNVRDDV